MAYPTTIDTFTNPAPTDPRSGATSASAIVSQLNDVASALEAKVGVNGSAVTTTIDYKLSTIPATDKAVSKTGTETLTNKTLTTPVITTPEITGGIMPDGSHTLTLPTVTDTLTGKGTTDVLTNKTLDSATNNVCANAIKSATTNVDTSGSIAPTAGYVLRANDSTHASWQDISGQLIEDFGSGADGDVIISVDTTLSRDMFYNSLTVNNGVTLNPVNYKIYVAGTLLNNGTISSNGGNGGNGGNGSGGTGGTGGIAGVANGGTAGQVGGAGGNTGVGGSNGINGTAVNPSLGVNGVISGAGGQGNTSVGAASTAGTATGETVKAILNGDYGNFTANSEVINKHYIYANGSSSGYTLSTSAGSGSGGGGGAGAGVVGGGGGGSGASGGVIAIIARIINNAGTICSNGGNGGNGGNGSTTNAGSGGGGGAGSGGVILLIYNTLTAGTITVNGGTKGLHGAGETTGTASTDGTDGLTGKYYKMKLL